MTKKLFIQAICKMALGIMLAGLLVFLPAGTLSYFNGWLLLSVLFVPMFLAGIIMMVKKPELLKRRLKAKETEKEQRLVIGLSGVMFIAGFIIAGFDFRYGWSRVSDTVIAVAVSMYLLSFLFYTEVIRENEYLSRTIEVQENQKVIDSGLYGIVRHPMYTATIIMFLSIPVILGSLYSLLVFLCYPFIIVKRIRHEEKLLEKELSGYKEYKLRVKYRLFPFVW